MQETYISNNWKICDTPKAIAFSDGRGSLSGYSFAIKDLFGVAGHISSFGHASWRASHEPASRTSHVITRLMDAGARAVGMSKMDQLAYSLIGNVGEGAPPTNPMHPDRFCGGSSSGSASAVASYACDFALGTDTAGSIRAPAAACGLFGLRPTHGSISTDGVIPLARSFDTVGILARSPKVLNAAWDCIHDPSSSTRFPGQTPSEVLVPGPHQAIPSELLLQLWVVGRSIASLYGISARRFDPAAWLAPKLLKSFSILQSAEVWKTHGAWVAKFEEHLDPEVLRRLVFGRESRDLAASEQVRSSFRVQSKELLTPQALLVWPTLATLPPKNRELPLDAAAYRKSTIAFTAPSSLAGFPQAVAPLAISGNSVSIIAAHGAEQMLLECLEALSTRTHILLPG